MDGPKSPDPLADPALRRALLDFVRRRLPPADADDVVQTVLCEALAAKALPTDAAELKKYLLGIARHKVADVHRRGAREQVRELPDLTSSPPPLEAASMLRWAERQAPGTEEAKKTLGWMARVVEGERLEIIAAEENVPAERVRQRVSRMRRWMKERWMLELAAVAALAVAALVLWRLLRSPEPKEVIAPDVSSKPLEPLPLDRARMLRADALRRCDEGAWRACLDGLDEAARLDPAGDAAPEVQAARERARRAPESPSPSPEDTKVPDQLLQQQKSAPAPTPSSRPAPTDSKVAPKQAPTSSKEAPSDTTRATKKPTTSGKSRKDELFFKK
jgi:DNA-directed RNA polymerase specialized sigma24 family protein